MGDPTAAPRSDGGSAPVPERLPDVPFATDGAALTALRTEVTAFLSREVERAGVQRLVVPMSGGVDSTTTAVLAVEAVGADRVLGLSLAAGEADPDAGAMASELGIEFAEADLSVLLDVFEDSIAPALSTDPDRLAVGNALSRFRAASAYFAANSRDGLVCGTANRTERLLGYFTKHGDGAADLFPLGHCWKTEVRALARLVGVPGHVVEKPPTAGFWPGQTDRDDLGAPYGFVDVALYLLVEADLGVRGTADELGVDPDDVERFARRHLDTRHKRRRPPTPADDPRPPQHFHEFELDH